MYKLTALSLQAILNRWTVITITVSLFIFIAWFLSSLRHKGKTKINIQDKFIKYIVITAYSFTAFLIFLTVFISVCSKTNPKDGPNIILIVIDCLKANNLGCYGYNKNVSPYIDELSKQSILFKNAYSNAPWTKPSVATIFTSLYPNLHNVINTEDVLPDEALTMAEILKNNGYYTMFLCGRNIFLGKEFNFAQGFDLYINKEVNSRDANLLTDKLISKIPELKKRRFFAYIHYMDLHLPYHRNNFNNSSSENIDNVVFDELSFITLRELTYKNQLSNNDKRRIKSIYDGQVNYVDNNVRRLLLALDNYNLRNNTLIIITADHGEEFWEHHNFEHGHTLYNELLHVPLIITGNKLKQSIINTRVRLIDLLPTVIDIANIKHCKSKYQGKSLAQLITQRESGIDLPVFATGTFYGTEKYCLIKENMKLIQNTDQTKGKKDLIGYINPGKTELYNLDKDRLETINLSNADKEKLKRLGKDLAKYVHVGHSLSNRRIFLNEELKEDLKSLGYVQ